MNVDEPPRVVKAQLVLGNGPLAGGTLPLPSVSIADARHSPLTIGFQSGPTELSGEGAPEAAPHEERVVERVVDGDLVLYDRASHRFFALNLSAALIWWGCDSGLSVAGILAWLAGYCPDSPALTLTYVSRTVNLFIVEGLLNE